MSQTERTLGTISFGKNYFLYVEVAQFQGAWGVNVRMYLKSPKDSGKYSGPLRKGLWIPLTIWDEIWEYLLTTRGDELNREFIPLKRDTVIRVYYEEHPTYGVAVHIRQFYKKDAEYLPSDRGVRIRYPDRWAEFLEIIAKYKPTKSGASTNADKGTGDICTQELLDSLLKKK